MLTTLTPEDLRVEIIRRRMSLYHLGAEVGVHPSRLGQMLNGKLPLRPAVAERIAAALREHETEQ